jgi:hypothetical protein
MLARTARRGLVALAAVAAATGTVLIAGQPAYAANSKVSVIHGIPGQPVDVYVNGSKTLNNFQPSAVAGPLDLPEGAYDIVLTKPGEPIAQAILKVDDAAVPGGANISLVAHLKADGAPTLTAFANDVTRLAAGKARLTVRHTAAAPGVDVRAGGQPVFRNLTNPNENKADVAAGTVDPDVVLTGTSTVALDPPALTLAEGTSTIVYAIGSAQGNSLSVVAQKIDGLHSAPGGVPSGTGGLAEPRTAAWWSVLVAVGLLLIAGGAARFATVKGRR